MKMITVAATVASLALAACGSSSNNKVADAGPATPVSNGGSSSASGSSGSGSTVNEAMHDNYFGTKTITGKPGATVTVKLVNEGQAQHNFKIDSQKNVDADLSPGQTKTVTLTIPKSGSVQFYCEYHKGLGMVGTVKSS